MQARGVKAKLSLTENCLLEFRFLKLIIMTNKNRKQSSTGLGIQEAK
jgi:hypothetical protein